MTDAPNTTAAPIDWRNFMKGKAGFEAGIPVEVATALSRAAHNHLHFNGINCPHDIGLVLIDALAPFWSAKL